MLGQVVGVAGQQGGQQLGQAYQRRQVPARYHGLSALRQEMACRAGKCCSSLLAGEGLVKGQAQAEGADNTAATAGQRDGRAALGGNGLTEARQADALGDRRRCH